MTRASTSRGARGIWVAAVAAGVLFASAAPRATASPRGRILNRRALKALRASRFAKARKLWLRAYRLDGAPKYLYNIARMSEELDRPVEALHYYERFVKLAHGKHRYGRYVLRASRRVRRLKHRLVALTVIADQPGVALVVEDHRLNPGPIEKTLWLRPGRIMVTATLKGYHGITKTLTLSPGARETLRIRLRKIVPKVVAKPATLHYLFPRWLPWTALGGGLVVVAGGGGALAAAAKKFDAFDYSVSIGAPDPRLKHQGEAYRGAGIGLMVTGAVLTVAGVVALFLNRPKLVPKPTAHTGPRLRPLVGLGSAGLVLEF